MKNFYSFIIFFFACTLFLWVQQAKVKLNGGDSELTLLSAQAILNSGNIGLNEYFSKVNQEEFAQGNWKYRFNDLKQQIEYIYPIGNVLLSVPFVYIANGLGYDMLLREHDQMWQSLLAGLSSVLIFLLLLKLLNQLTDKWNGLVLALLFSWGTTLMSTCGAAFWSFNSELIFLLLATEVWVRQALQSQYKPNYFLLGFYLFMAWLCRPSALIMAILFFVWSLLKRNLLAWKTAATILGCFVLFVFLSVNWFGTWLPFYYNPFFWQSMPKTVSLAEGFLLVQFSPARGLFVFSPFLLLGLVVFFTHYRRHPLVLASFVWIVTYFLVLGNLSNWWGGWCFGPRLCTDLLPAFAVLLAFGLKGLSGLNQLRKVTYILLGLMGMISVYFHSVVALHNSATFSWNDYPAIDAHSTFYKWNWNYPQFAASDLNNERKKLDFEGREKWAIPIQNVPEGAAILFGKPTAQNAVLLSLWNKEKVFGERKLYSSVNALMQHKQDTFYFFEENYNSLSSREDIGIMPYRQQNLKDFCLRNKEHIIVALSKGNQVPELPVDALAHLENRGLRIMNKTGAEIMWVLANDQLKLAEVVNDTRLDKQLLIDSTLFSLSVSHEMCSLKIGENELSINHDGLCLMVLNKKMQLIETGYLDRFTGSTVWSTMNLKGYLKKRSIN